jgi:fructosamine-3-kinase
MLDQIQLSGLTIAPATVEQMVRLDVDETARVRALTPLTGPAVSTVLRVDLEGGRSVVCKVRPVEGDDAFDLEAYQLGYLADRTSLPVPKVLAYRKDGGPGAFTYLILEQLPGSPWETVRPPEARRLAEADLGEALGRMHAEMTAIQYGSVRPEPGPTHPSWAGFFANLWEETVESVLRSDRLDPLTFEAVEWIHRNVHSLLGLNPTPRLVHGNLIADNLLCQERDAAWRLSGILDPDLLYGHHEVDLALLEFHCGVGEAFFERYRQFLAIEEGYTLRRHVYRLYFVLNQVRLYGSSHHILAAMEASREILQQCGC